MKQLITALLALWSVTTMAGLPPTTLGGQAGSSATTFNFKVPNNLATKTATGGLLELGNENILENPDFEHKTFDTGWTCSLGTPTVETTKKFGTQSFKIASTGAGVRCYQYITNNASNLKGTQGVVRAMINSDDSALQVCALVDGTTSTYDTNCKTIPVTTTNTPWVAVEIPYIMGGTGNGIVIKSATTTTQAIYADKMVVAPAPYLTASVSGAKLLGTITFTGCANPWSTNSATLVNFSSQTGCASTLTGQAQAPSSNIPAIKFASLPPGDYRLEYEGEVGIAGANGNAIFQFWDGTNTARESSSVFAGAGSNTPGISQTISYSTTQSNVTLSIRAKTATANAQLFGTTANPGVIKVWYFPPESKIYSQGASSFVDSFFLAQSSSFTNATITGAQTSSTSNGILSYNSSTGIYTALRDCTVSAHASFTATSSTVEPQIVKGSTVMGVADGVNSATYAVSTSASFQMSAGETFYFKNASSTNATNAQRTTVTALLSYPTIVGSFAGYTEDSKIVSASYWLSSNFAASTTTPINFDTKEWDNCNPSCVTTSSTAWKFTAPTSGVYSISGFSNITTTTSTVILVYKNGSALKTLTYNYQGQANFFGGKVRLLAGDYIDIRPNTSVTISGGSLSTAGISHFSISRIGPY